MDVQTLAMKIPRQPLGTPLLGLLLVCQRVYSLPNACSEFVTAKSGDTCASIAISAGIGVADFLRDNPSVSSCDSLSVGSTYCVDSTTLQLSPEGQCGGNFTCLGSKYGQCCSEHGW